jgi:hypothetical protein
VSGLCPLQVITGGGEVLRDEQIYLAHKAAHPTAYPPCPDILARNGDTQEDIARYPPTDVQLLVFDDCPHVAPVLGHTRGAKFEYRAISQFAAWALARAQGVEVGTVGGNFVREGKELFVSRAGDPIPPFVDHMIRQHVDREGRLYSMKPAEEIRACTFSNEEIGWPKEKALKGWIEYRKEVDRKYSAEKKKGESWPDVM